MNKKCLKKCFYHLTNKKNNHILSNGSTQKKRTIQAKIWYTYDCSQKKTIKVNDTQEGNFSWSGFPIKKSKLRLIYPQRLPPLKNYFLPCYSC